MTLHKPYIQRLRILSRVDRRFALPVTQSQKREPGLTLSNFAVSSGRDRSTNTPCYKDSIKLSQLGGFQYHQPLL